MLIHQGSNGSVAPYVGAWIETVIIADLCPANLSHPTWVRGLKHTLIADKCQALLVAPYVGAWIETSKNYV